MNLIPHIEPSPQIINDKLNYLPPIISTLDLYQNTQNSFSSDGFNS
jgi:hypothetical protein